LADQVLDGDRVTVASLAGAILSILPAAPGPMAAAATVTVYDLARDVSDDGVRALVSHLEALPRTDLADVLDDVLELSCGVLTSLQAAAREESENTPGGTAGEAAGGAGPVEPGEGVTTRLTGPGSVAVYYLAAGMDLFLDQSDVRTLLQMAESGTSPLVCWLCDDPIEVAASASVNLGLQIPVGREDAPLVPVWTHPGCGRPRIWTAQQVDAACHGRGLPVHGAAPTPPSPGPRDQAEADWSPPAWSALAARSTRCWWSSPAPRTRTGPAAITPTCSPSDCARSTCTRGGWRR
ncbi:hypothetical protein AB0J52_13000, partial [Spirillospora sp. NPDC049652]